MSSPLTRSKNLLERLGWTVAKVEYWNSFAKPFGRRVDLFGFADLACFNKDQVLLVQTTSNANVSARIDKIRGIQAAELWLASPNRKIVVHGWSKKGARGQRKLWTVREVEITSLTQPKETSP